MPGSWDQVPGQLMFPGPPQPSPRIIRAMRRGPRTRMTRQPRTAAAQPVASVAGEWHEMSPGQQFAGWAALRAWVAWLYDRYELSADDKLPACWPQHPGLIEELYALKAWREEIYGAGQFSGQAARYWHTELRQVIHAATSIYAVGCRTGHRPAPRTAAADPVTRARWAALSPLTGISEPDLTAGDARRTGTGWAATPVIADAIETGTACPIPDLIPDGVALAGTIWTPQAGGWIPAHDTGEHDDQPD